MSEHEHVTKDEIAAFAAKTLSVEKHRTVARHMLRCSDCRNDLPMPTTEEFFRALLDESVRPQDGEKDNAIR